MTRQRLPLCRYDGTSEISIQPAMAACDLLMYKRMLRNGLEAILGMFRGFSVLDQPV